MQTSALPFALSDTGVGRVDFLAFLVFWLPKSEAMGKLVVFRGSRCEETYRYCRRQWVCGAGVVSAFGGFGF